MAETCAWFKEKKGIFFTKYKERRRSHPLGNACGRTISSGCTSLSTSALAAGEEKRGETGWNGNGFEGQRVEDPSILTELVDPS